MNKSNLCDHGELVVLIWNVGYGHIDRAVFETLNLKLAHLFDTFKKFNINSVLDRAFLGIRSMINIGQARNNSDRKYSDEK